MNRAPEIRSPSTTSNSIRNATTTGPTAGSVVSNGLFLEGSKPLVDMQLRLARWQRAAWQQLNPATIFWPADQCLRPSRRCARPFDNRKLLSQVRYAALRMCQTRWNSNRNVDIGNEEYRAQIKTLQYELETMKQERELATVHHTKELRDLQTKAEAEYKKAQVGACYLVNIGNTIADDVVADF